MKKTKKKNNKIKKSNLSTLILFIVLILLIFVYFLIPNKQSENIKVEDVGKEVYEELKEEVYERNGIFEKNKENTSEEILEFVDQDELLVNQDELLKVTSN